MASPDPPPLTRVRTPKLTYRTKSLESSSIQTSSTDNTRLTNSTQLTSSTGSDVSPLPSPGIPPTDGCSQANSRRPSIAITSTSSNACEKGTKKKSSFLSGLFSVKEPSAQALVEYQQQMMRQAGGGKSRVTPVGMPGISSASLPPTVPKVNSKWDGVPLVIKEKEKKKQLNGRKSMSLLNESIHSGNSKKSEKPVEFPPPRRPQSRETLGGASMYSGGSQNRLAELYGWETPYQSSTSSIQDKTSERPRPSTSRSTSSRNVLVLQTPPLPKDHPSPIKVPQIQLECSTQQHSTSPTSPSHCQSSNVSPQHASSATPNTPPPLKCLTSHDLRYDSPDDDDISPPKALLSSDDVVVKSAGADVLGPPASATPRSRVSPQQRTKTFGADGMLAPDPSSCESQRVKMPPDVDTSPGVIQHQRHKSAQERLHLGLSLKHQAVPPWTWSEMHPETKAVGHDGGRIVSPSPQEGSQCSRRKRLAFFKK